MDIEQKLDSLIEEVKASNKASEQIETLVKDKFIKLGGYIASEVPDYSYLGKYATKDEFASLRKEVEGLKTSIQTTDEQLEEVSNGLKAMKMHIANTVPTYAYQVAVQVFSHLYSEVTGQQVDATSVEFTKQNNNDKEE